MENCTEMTTTPSEESEVLEDVTTADPAKVILFNDDVHSFDEVITQIIKALKCDQAKAESIALEAHNNGRAIAYAGELVRCMQISSVLEEIQLRTQIEV
jgi:ATP-dependent Clp protease adapter protein ClpS